MNISKILVNIPGKDEARKVILIFNDKEYIQCDSCGQLTDEAPCRKCGASPIKDLDNLQEEEGSYRPGSYRPGSYFHDG